MSVNGSGPRRRLQGPRISRRLALPIGAGAALVIGAVLVAPVVLLTGGSSRAKPCAPTLLYASREYLARPVPRDAVVQAVAVGVGVASGCGGSPANVDVRTLAGVRPAVAVGLAGEGSAIYVRRGVCRVSESELVACLRR